MRENPHIGPFGIQVTHLSCFPLGKLTTVVFIVYITDEGYQLSTLLWSSGGVRSTR